MVRGPARDAAHTEAHGRKRRREQHRGAEVQLVLERSKRNRQREHHDALHVGQKRNVCVVPAVNRLDICGDGPVRVPRQALQEGNQAEHKAHPHTPAVPAYTVHVACSAVW